ncbi:hypothetical protein Tco_0858113 [Tanacetum coccineum]|uniref:Uncharacterized protein n=1 Tax=Tanacetum coccineum TaxID=301880 RepID=A0ABQ5BC17_9ASTR
MAKDTIATVTSVLTQKDLDEFCIKWRILASVEPQFPGPNDTIRDSLEGKIGSNVIPLVTVGSPLKGVEAEIPLMGLSDFIKSSDPFKVKVKERTLSQGEPPFLKETKDRVIPPSSETLSMVVHTIMDELKNAAGKKKKRVAFNDGLPSVKKVMGSSSYIPSLKKPTTAGSAIAAMDEFVPSSVTPSPDHEYQNESAHKADASFTLAHKAGTSSAPSHEVGTSSSASGGDSLVDEFYESQTINSSTAKDMYIPNWDITNDYQVNVNTAQHACMVSELHLWYNHEIEIASLKSRLEKAESEATEVVRLRGRDSELEVAFAARMKELAVLGAKYAELLGQVSGLESSRDELKDQVSKLESVCEDLKGEIQGEAKMIEEFMVMQDVETQRIEK